MTGNSGSDQLLKTSIEQTSRFNRSSPAPIWEGEPSWTNDSGFSQPPKIAHVDVDLFWKCQGRVFSLVLPLVCEACVATQASNGSSLVRVWIPSGARWYLCLSLVSASGHLRSDGTLSSQTSSDSIELSTHGGYCVKKKCVLHFSREVPAHLHVICCATGHRYPNCRYLVTRPVDEGPTKFPKRKCERCIRLEDTHGIISHMFSDQGNSIALRVLRASLSKTVNGMMQWDVR